MGHDEIRTVGERLVGEALALRAAHPDADAMRGLPVSEVPAAAAGEAGAALRALRDEMLLVRVGAAGTLIVLDDEAARVERLVRAG